jgi:sugar O-acyltransferase (sialic acid O-acetyltransferase NeuD family)
MISSELTILGMSEGCISMIFDILESNNQFPKISIVNNLGIIPTKEYLRESFIVDQITEFENIDGDFIIGASKPKVKMKIMDLYKRVPISNFVKLISSKCDISNTTVLGNGSIVNSMTCIAAHTTIKDFVFINRGCTIGHHTVINNYVTLNPAVNIASNVSVGESTLIGIGTNIIDGINIGSNSIIGAGSVVTKDIPDGVIAYGSPCKIIRANEA